MKPGHKQTEVDTIPDEWQVVPFLSAVQIANGQVDPRIEPYRSMILIAPDHIESGSGRLIQERTASAQAAISGKYLFDSGDIVYSKIRPYLRKATIARFQGLCSADMYPLKTRKGVESGFILPVILGHRFSIFAEGVSARTGIPKINREDLSAFSIALPPQSEQRAIAAALSDVDALLSSLDALIAKKRDIKQAAMQQLLTGKTRLPGFKEEWAVTRLGDHATLIRNGVYSRAELSIDGSVKYLHYGDIHTSGAVHLNPSEAIMPFLDADKAVRLGRLVSGDLVFVDATEDLAGVGKSVEVVGAEGTELVAGLHTIAVRFDKRILADGFKAYIQFIPAFGAHLRSLAAGTKVLSTNRSHIASAEIALPSIAEQAAIAQVLSDMDADLAALEARRDKTRLLKQGMMQELLTGKTRLV